MEKFINLDKKTLKQMGKNGKEYEASFSKNDLIKKLEKIFIKLSRIII